MKLRIWTYHLKNAVANILVNRLIHAISVGTITISLFLLGAFFLFFVNINNWMLEWGQSLSMSIYLEDDIGAEQKKNLESEIKKLPGTDKIRFVSKKQAKTDLREALGEQAGLLDGIITNPLPASFEVVFKEFKGESLDPRNIKIELEKMLGVDEVQYSEQWLERFEGFIQMLRIAGLVVGGVFCVAVLFIITNTIKLTIYSRREEIEILKIVGATDWFIKIPFLIEGAIQGVFSGSIALSSLFLFYTLFSMKTVHAFGFPVMDMAFLPGKYSIFILSLSLALGILGSFVAIGRFFRLIR